MLRLETSLCDTRESKSKKNWEVVQMGDNCKRNITTYCQRDEYLKKGGYKLFKYVNNLGIYFNKQNNENNP